MPRDTPEHGNGSLFSDMLRRVTHFVSRRPTFTLWMVALVSFASVALTLQHIRFKTERADLIDPRADFHQRWVEYAESFGDSSDLVVVVEADKPDTVMLILDDLGPRIEREPEIFSDVLFKVESGNLRGKGLQYLSPRQLESGLARLRDYTPIIRGRWDLIRIDRLYDRMGAQLQPRLASTRPTNVEPLLDHAELLTNSMTAYLTEKGPHRYRSPWPNLFPVDRHIRDQANYATYLTNQRGTLGFLKTRPTGTGEGFDGAHASIDRLRELIAEIAPDYPGAKIGLTGIPVLESDEMIRSKSDMLRASIVSFAGVGLLLFLGFRGFRHPMMALVMLAVGMTWAFGFTTLAVGHLNILSVSFAAILIGLGIDFAIHYLARYLELRRGGKMLRPALAETSRSVGAGIVTAAVTTALAFFSASFTQFLGVAELGIIAGGGILLCAAATFVVLPALVALADRRVDPAKLPTLLAGERLRGLTGRFPRIMAGLSILILVGIGSQIVEIKDGQIGTRIRYDYNLLNLQAKGLESVDVQKQAFHQAGDSLLYAVSMADSPREVRALRRRFEALPSVHHVEELASRLPAYAPDNTRLLIQSYRAQLANLPRSVPRMQNADPAQFGRSLERFYIKVRNSGRPQARRIAGVLDKFLDRFERLPLGEQARFIGEYQQRTAYAMLAQLHALGRASDSRPIRMSDLPDELTSRFLSPKGKWLLQIYPQEEIWDVEPLARFVHDVRSVDPDVTGTPLQNFEASRQIKISYMDASVYALAVICLVLLVDFLDPRKKWLALLPPLAIVLFAAAMMQARRMEVNYVMLAAAYIAMAALTAAVLDFENLRDAVLAMFPPLAGGLAMFGLLGLMGIDLNPANLIVLPLVLGIGVDDGVHVVHDFRSQRSGYRMSASTINAITLTSLTSMIGFGSMMLAAHRGLYSVGLVLVIGVGSCLFISLITLPAFLTLISQRKHRGNSSTASRDVSGNANGGKRRQAKAA